MSPPTDRQKRFGAYLEGLAATQNRAALAALRRGLGKRPGEVSDPAPYVDPWLSPRSSSFEEEAYFLVASLFGLHQIAWHSSGDTSSPTNLGASFARLARDNGSASTDRRFIALLNSHRDDLGAHLRHGMSLLRTKEVPVDWAQLLQDILGWDRDRRDAQRAWARAYWGADHGDGAVVAVAVSTTNRDSDESEG